MNEKLGHNKGKRKEDRKFFIPVSGRSGSGSEVSPAMLLKKIFPGITHCYFRFPRIQFLNLILLP